MQVLREAVENFNGLLTIYLIYGEPEHMKDDYLRDYIIPSNKMDDSFWEPQASTLRPQLRL